MRIHEKDGLGRFRGTLYDRAHKTNDPDVKIH